MKLFTIIIALVLIVQSESAHAGYYVSVCGTTADRVQKFFAQAAHAEDARREALNQCERATGTNCLEPKCENVFQPTEVSELPPRMKQILRQRLQAVEREARRNASRPVRETRRADGWDEYAGIRAVTEQARKNREAEIEKLLEYARQCQGMSGCPKGIP